VAESGLSPAKRRRVCATDAVGAFDRGCQLVDGAPQPTFDPSGYPAQCLAGVVEHRVRVAAGVLGQPGQFTGQSHHRGLRLVTAGGGAQLEFGPDRPYPGRGRTGPVPKPGAGSAASGFDPPYQLADLAYCPGQQARIGGVLNVGRHDLLTELPGVFFQVSDHTSSGSLDEPWTWP
jgi:hypothetical protein